MELSLQARMSLTQLAKRAQLSKQVVSYRLKGMEKAGIIRGYHAIPNITRLGKTHYRVFVKYQNMTKELETDLLNYLSARPEISWLTLLDGDFDLEFVVWTGNIMEFEKIYDDILGNFGNLFHEKYFSIGTRVEYLPYRFLDLETDSNPIVFGDCFENYSLDSLEKRIIKEINHNGRIPFSTLAQLCQISINSVKAKVEHLMDCAIILGFGLKVNQNLIGFTHRKVLLKLNQPSKEKIESISNYLRQQPNVIFLIKTIGAYDFEFELMTRSNEEFYHIVREFRSQFSHEIKLHHTVMVHDELKYGHLDF